MSRREVIVGGGISFVVLVLFIFFVIDAVELSSQYSPPPITSDNVQSIIGWVVTECTFLSLVLATSLVWHSVKHNKQLFEKLTLRATIPGYFVLTFIPVAMGIALAVVAGLVNWGIWLSCLSVPALMIFVLIALKSNLTKKAPEKEE